MLKLALLLLLFFPCIVMADEPPRPFNFFQSSSLDIAEDANIPEIEGVKDGKDDYYHGEEDISTQRKVAQHQIFQKDRLRIYNNSQYDLGDLKNRYQQGQLQKADVSDISLSVGYGMEYELKQDQWIGYEYLSSFPQDYGQSIRVFIRQRF